MKIDFRMSLVASNNSRNTEFRISYFFSENASEHSMFQGYFVELESAVMHINSAAREWKYAIYGHY